MEDELDDVEEQDFDEEVAVGEEDEDDIPMSSVLGYEPPHAWKRPSGRTLGISRTRTIAARKRWLEEPDVLGYLNSFKHLTDGDRLRLARACANYLNHQERLRNGYFQMRKSKKQSAGRSIQENGSAPAKTPLKRSRSVRDLSQMLDLEAKEAISAEEQE